MNLKASIRVFLYTIILMCSITMFSTPTSNAKYYKTEDGVVKYGAKFKKMSADADSYTVKILSATLENMTLELSFDRSGNSKAGERDQYDFELVPTNFTNCSVSISDSNGAGEQSGTSIMFDKEGNEKVTAKISCDVPSGLDDNAILGLRVNVKENIFYGHDDAGKLSYDYIKEPYPAEKASEYYRKHSAPEGVDADDSGIYYMPTNVSDKNNKILDWLKYYDKSNYPAIEAYINSYSLSDNYIENTIPKDGTSVELVSGISAQLVDGKYKFTVTDNFNNYVSTFNASNYFSESRKNDPMRFYFEGVENNKDAANALFYEYLEKYYKNAPSVTEEQYNTVKNYIESRLKDKNVIEWSKSNKLGIIYSESSRTLTIPKADLYNNLTTKYKSSELYIDNSSNLVSDVYDHLDIYKFLNNTTIPSSIVRSSLIDCIKTDGTPFDNYSYYIDGDTKALVHVYFKGKSEEQIIVGMEITLIEDNTFTMVYNVTPESIESDIESIETNVADKYEVSSAINGNEVTITLTEKIQTSSSSDTEVLDTSIDNNVGNESQDNVVDVPTDNTNSNENVDIE